MTTAVITNEVFLAPLPPCNKLEHAMWTRINTHTQVKLLDCFCFFPKTSSRTCTLMEITAFRKN